MPRRDLQLLVAAIALGLLVRVVYVLVTWDHTLAGDEIEYHLQASFIADGDWFWSSTPYGIPHPSAWKTPVYPLFVGLLYGVGGKNPDAVILLQVLVLGPLTITLTWLLGRRLFGAWVGTAAAFVAAAYPFVWQFEARLFAEALATPLTLGILLLVLDRRPSTRAIVAAGALSGVLILVKPSALHILAAVVAAILIGWGLREGIGTNRDRARHVRARDRAVDDPQLRRVRFLPPAFGAGRGHLRGLQRRRGARRRLPVGMEAADDA